VGERHPWQEDNSLANGKSATITKRRGSRLLVGHDIFDLRSRETRSREISEEDPGVPPPGVERESSTSAKIAHIRGAGQGKRAMAGWTVADEHGPVAVTDILLGGKSGKR